jgi:multimeric flavodoxin WrbA
MKFIAINGSPRKNWNTASLLKKTLNGAAAAGAETEIFHLYDLDFKGCTSCFACKLKVGPSYGNCAMNDDLTPVLEKIEKADALVMGSPVYFGDVSGEMRSFMERLCFPYLVYRKKERSIFPGKLKTAFIYTMNLNEEAMRIRGYDKFINDNERLFKMLFGNCEFQCVFDTLQFDDYSKYVSDIFDPEKKGRKHRENFPEDLEKSFELGKRLARKG